MKLIRNNIFETNSSSTHCLVLSSLEEYDKWVNNEGYYIDLYNGKLVDQATYDRMLREAILVNTKFDFNWDNHTVTYNGVTVDYDNYKEKLVTEENLKTISEKEIENYRNDYYEYYNGETPLSHDEFESYCEDSNYYTFEERREDLNVAASGYYGNDY